MQRESSKPMCILVWLLYLTGYMYSKIDHLRPMWKSLALDHLRPMWKSLAPLLEHCWLIVIGSTVHRQCRGYTHYEARKHARNSRCHGETSRIFEQNQYHPRVYVTIANLPTRLLLRVVAQSWNSPTEHYEKQLKHNYYSYCTWLLWAFSRKSSHATVL